MRSTNPIKSGVAFAALGAAYHGIRVVRVALGWAQPHSIGSLGFPLTASIIIGATAIIGFIVGYGLGIAWNRLATAPVRTRAVWLIVSFVICRGCWLYRLGRVPKTYQGAGRRHPA
jgi:hypothetical protein